MYISVDVYEEMYLENKGADTVFSEVNKLRREIARLKNKMESPTYTVDSKKVPSDLETVGIYREYLLRAESVLSQITGDLGVLDEERKSALYFDSNIESVVCLTLTIGRYFEHKYELRFSDLGAKIFELHLGEEPTSRDVDENYVKAAILSLHLGEWSDVYTPEKYGCNLSEPVKWQLRVDFDNGAAPRYFDGRGVFPYNFSIVEKLFAIDII